MIAYIDGFNLYFGMRAANLRRFYWLDVVALARSVLTNGQRLDAVKYFTARISGNAAKQQRQTAYLEALATHSNPTILLGNYQVETFDCHNCRGRLRVPKEKMTDVRIATEMLVDAQQDRCEVAILITGDSDLVPPVEAIAAYYPRTRVAIAFPPARHSAALEKAVSRRFVRLTDTLLKKSQLPDEVMRADGFKLARPDRWN